MSKKLFNVLMVNPGLESTDSKQTNSASSQQFDSNRDVQIMNIEDKNNAQGSSSKDDTDGDDDEVTNDNGATGVVEADHDNAISEDKPIFDGNTPSLAEGAGKVPESKYPIFFHVEKLSY